MSTRSTLFQAPTVEVDQDKYDKLVIRSEKYTQLIMNLEKETDKTENFDFGKAIQYLKQGQKVQREGWNGKNQYIELATNISYMNANNEEINAEHEAIGNKAIAFVGTSGIQLGWLASQADMLAEDWKIVKEED